MPESIIFRGVVVRHFDVRQSPKGETVYVNAHLSADWTDVVREAMGWEDLPETYGGADIPSASLMGVEMMLKPSARELKAFAIKMPIREVKDFQLVTLKQPGEMPDERELRFTVTSQAKQANTWLGNWLRSVGKHKGQLTVSYTEQATLEEVDVTPTQEQRQAALKEND